MNLFQRYLASEFAEDCEEGRLTRREALKMIASITGSLVMANSILAACAPPPDETAATQSGPAAEPVTETSPPAAADTPVEASLPTATENMPEASQATATNTPAAAGEAAPAAHGTVMPDDPAVIAGQVEFQGQDALLQGYLARPAGEGAFPVILVCHENRGLTDHIRDVARRLAKAGYVALAVDLLSRQGGTADLDSSAVPGALSGMPPDQYVQDFRSGWLYLQEQSYAQTERVGMIGFCFGGGVTWQVAAHMPELKAAAPFYGPHPELEDVPNIQAAVLAIYGEQDQRINQGIPAIEEAMSQNGKLYQKMIYPGADHAFFNDTGSRYNAEAAQDAWGRVLAWFAEYV